MLAAPRRKRYLWAAAAAAFLALLALSAWLVGAPPPKRITLATGDPAGGFAALGAEYRDRLGRMGLKVEPVPTTGSLDNLGRLARGEVDVAFVQCGVSRLRPELVERLRGIAAVYREPLWIFARGKPVDSLAAFKGRALGLGPADSGTDAVSRQLLAAHGVDPTNTRFVNCRMGEVADRMRAGTLDAAFLVASYRAAAVQALSRQEGVRLVNLRRHAALARHFPYLTPVKLSQGTLDLAADLPPEDVTLLAPATLLVCREDLHPRAVEQILLAAQALQGGGDLMGDAGQFPSLEGLDLPPHVAAEKFMKSGESLAARLLPYWAVRLVFRGQLLLIPLLALAIPFFRTLPLLYHFRVNRLLRQHYAALGRVEGHIERADGPEALRRDLEALDNLRKDMEGLSRKVPGHFQREVFHWRLHVALVRTEALDRLRRLEEEEKKAFLDTADGQV